MEFQRPSKFKFFFLTDAKRICANVNATAANKINCTDRWYEKRGVTLQAITTIKKKIKIEEIQPV